MLFHVFYKRKYTQNDKQVGYVDDDKLNDMKKKEEQKNNRR